MITTLHPAVPIALHPGVGHPTLAAGRPTLGILYRTYAAIEDGNGPPGTVAAALVSVNACLEELRSYYTLMLATGGNVAVARGTIQRAEAAKALLQERCQS